jgi:hypothetical protein
MIVLLTCPSCEEELPFEVNADSDELVCTGCGIHTDFAPDPVATFLYEAA